MKLANVRLMILPLLLASLSLYGQDKTGQKDPKVSFKAVGSVAVTYQNSANSVFLTFGGPGVRMDYGKFSLAFHFFPSVRYFMGNVNDAKDAYRTKTEATTILGVGPQVGYKKLALVFPFYYMANNNVWVMSAGVGYKL